MLAAALALLLAAVPATAPSAAPVPRPPTPAAAPVPDRPPVILVSIDGFRADYLKRGLTPTLQALADDGVRAVGMRPSFPSLTFPNHYTLVTGLVPDHHGIVQNEMEDARIQPDHHFTLRTYAAVSDARWWDEAEPIWVTAQKAGLRTGTLFWPGSEAPIEGVRPDRWMHFDATVTPDQRVDLLMDWLDQPAGKRPHFLTLYFDAVDHAAHEHGPDSPEVDAALRQTDAALAHLMAGLQARGLDRSANLVIVADHGMAAVPEGHVMYVDDAAPPADLDRVSLGAVAEFAPKGPGGEAALARLLAWRTPHGSCWRKADIPAHFRYGTNPRIPPVVCIAQAGWIYAVRPPPGVTPDLPRGEHGYDPADPLMAALFVAHGAAFRRGYVQPVFDNVDVQPLLAHLLHLQAPSADGRLSDLAGALAP